MADKPNAAPARLASILIRGHKIDSKFMDLWNKLPKDSTEFDVFAIMDCNNDGSIPPDNFISQTRKDLEKIGLVSHDFVNGNTFWLCGDIAFALALEHGIKSDYLIMIDYDVEFKRGPEAYIYDLLSRIKVFRSPESCFGVLGLHYGPMTGDYDELVVKWPFYKQSREMFEDVWFVYYPFVCMSRAAAHYLWSLRRFENCDRDFDKAVICESFTPSALKKAGFWCGDLNDLFPNSYSWRSMGLQHETGQAYPLGLPLGSSKVESMGVELVHAVYSMEDYIKKGLERASSNRERLTEMHAVLSSADFPNREMSLVTEAKNTIMHRLSELPS